MKPAPSYSFAKYSTVVLITLFSLAFFAGRGRAQEAKPESKPAAPADGKKLDPAAWGEDHVGKEMPDYVTGDQCLFCHRNDIGPTWDKNKHGRTVRFTDKDKPPLNELDKTPELKKIAQETELIMGRDSLIRFLKPSGEYGKLAMATASLVPAHGQTAAVIKNGDNPTWDKQKFANGCAGCHATAVESKAAAYGAFSLDCYSCHGDVTLDHTNDTRLMHLSRKRGDKPQIVASICAQCHLRGAKSKSTGRPYADQFIAGDNLFKDFQADFSDKFIDSLNPGDRHIYHNIRDIVVEGVEHVTCLTCHEVHVNSSAKHTVVRESAMCLDCHKAGEPKNKPIKYEVHSGACEY